MLNPILKIVHVDDKDKNPSSDEVALACSRRTTLNFAYEMDTEKAAKVGIKPKGLMPLYIDSFSRTVGAVIFTGLLCREGQQPTKISGIYTPPIAGPELVRQPASGTLEMHVR
jgi:hypothetical protein